MEDIGVDAVKIGMLADEAVIRHVAAAMVLLRRPLVVVDPVMIATSGAVLVVAEGAVAALRARLFPLATVITPNLPELEHLAGPPSPGRGDDLRPGRGTGRGERSSGAGERRPCRRRPDHRRAGHRPAQAPHFYEHARINTRHTHGTGCTLSSAIATLLGRGETLPEAVRLAREFVFSAIEAAPGYGAGHGPLGHQAVRRP
ncbi:MAG: bifunctional hydroxymethylpyrimidine kinase/phosphomethylpyrimidine kinase [Mycobacterium sp.]|nr:bifunctional hydroxymethylpyrimidine kinase/phosphomethylpyrimidine kinase [Mycobacterium sp.]